MQVEGQVITQGEGRVVRGCLVQHENSLRQHVSSSEPLEMKINAATRLGHVIGPKSCARATHSLLRLCLHLPLHMTTAI